jgi:hypothetical protein
VLLLLLLLLLLLQWLSMRLELTGAVVVFAAAVAVGVVSPRNAGLAGLALTSALNLTGGGGGDGPCADNNAHDSTLQDYTACKQRLGDLIRAVGCQGVVFGEVRGLRKLGVGCGVDLIQEIHSNHVKLHIPHAVAIPLSV